MAVPRFDFAHVPVTFAAYFNEQLRGWESLFPAEQAYFERLGAYLEKIPAALFAPLAELEPRMGVTPQTWPRGRFTLQQVDFLNRNALYPEWRRVITQIFDQINPVLDGELAAKGQPRLVMVLAPADLPVGPDRMWTRLKGRGRRVSLAVPDDLAHYVPLALTGKPVPDLAGSLLDLCAAARGPYSAWSVETGEVLAGCANKATELSYEKLSVYRQRLMEEVQKIAEKGEVRGPRQLGEKLKTLQPRDAEYSRDPVMSEFVRATLLAGNGTLLVNNTFVEWATVQAIRRAKPSLLVASFGIRNKVKPFSSLLIFEDQDKATAIPTQADMLGSYVDLEIFYQYVFQEAGKYVEYRNNTAYLFLAEGMDEMHLIAPPDFPLSAGERLPLTAIYRAAREWLRLA
ncbi:MAG: hypothetical protein NTV70_12755 [Acidobacteria bacterium]|nr:hypothetical protein [Acidobacteriota bacterium]